MRILKRCLNACLCVFATLGMVAVLLVPPLTARATASSVSCLLGAAPSCQGLAVMAAHVADSQFTSTALAGKAADVFQQNTAPGGGALSYIYFQVKRASGFLASQPATLYLSVEYYDEAQGAMCAAGSCYLTANYGSSANPYAGTPSAALTGQKQWRWVTWELPQVSFQEQENNQADFRLAGTVGMAVHRVVLSPQPPVATTTTLQASAGQVVEGHAVTFTATVQGKDPTGTVTFRDGTVQLGTGALGSGGTASLTTAALPVGTQAITAAYAGDAGNQPSTSAAVDEVVTGGPNLVADPSGVRGDTQNWVAPSVWGTLGGVPVSGTWWLRWVSDNVQSHSPAPGSAWYTYALPNLTPGQQLSCGFKAMGQGTIMEDIWNGGGDNLTAPVTLTSTPQVFTETVTVASKPWGSPPGVQVRYMNQTGNLDIYFTDVTCVVGPSVTLAADSPAPVATTTTLQASAGQVVEGHAVTFTATVQGKDPTGTVTFRDGTVQLGTGALGSGGTASLTTAALPVGTQAITAAYAGDAGNQPSTSAAVDEVVTGGPNLVADPSGVRGDTQNWVAPSVWGTLGGVPVSGTWWLRWVSDNVQSHSPAPGSAWYTYALPNLTPGQQLSCGFKAMGQGTIMEDIWNGGGDNLTAPVTLTSTPQVFTETVTVASKPWGSPPGVQVRYMNQTGNLDIYFTDVTCVVGPSVTLVADAPLTPMPTSTSLTAAPDAGVAGQPVTLTATVKGFSPTGSVTFKDGTATLGKAALGGNGQATFATSGLNAGIHSLTAVYAGDPANQPSTSPMFSETILQTAPASVSCLLGASPSCQGLAIMDAHAPDSHVTSTTLAGKTADVFEQNTAPGGDQTSYIYFQVNRTSGFLASNPATLYLTVEYYDQSQAGACSTSAPCYLGYNYGSAIPTAPVNGAYAGSATQSLGGAPVWTRVTWELPQVSFQEQENNQADFRLAGTVGLAVHRVVLSLRPPAATSTGLTVAPDPAVVGQAVTLTATVQGASPGAPMTFLDGPTVLGTGTLGASGQATLATSALAVGSHSLSALYTGDASHQASASSQVTESVLQALPATVFCMPSATIACQGLTVVGAHVADSAFTTATVAGKTADVFQKNPIGNNPMAYLYFQVDRASGFLMHNPSTLYLSVEYYDQPQVGACGAPGSCSLGYNYGSTIATAPVNGAYGGTATQELQGAPAWRWVTWKLTQASFREQENNLADFRIAGSVGVAVHRVVLSLQPLATTATSVSVAPSPSPVGHPVTLTATVMGASPTGTVVFQDGTTILGTGTLAGKGQAAFTTSALALGSHSLTAAYSGDANNQASVSAPSTAVIFSPNAAATVGVQAQALSLPVGGTTTLSGTILGYEGNPLSHPPLVLTATAGALGPVSFNAIGGYTATFTAPATPGSVTVTASVDAVSSQTTLLITPAGVGVTRINVASGGAALPGISAFGTGGTGQVLVANYGGDPVGTPAFPGAPPQYFDVALSASNTFTSLTLQRCGLNSGQTLYWWNGAMWALVDGLAGSSSDGCLTVTLGPDTSPSLAQLTQTAFTVGAGVPTRPVVVRVEPGSGTPAGHTPMIIYGFNFDNATAVDFGGTPALSFKVESPTAITALTPAGTGTVGVRVTTPEGTSEPGLFTYSQPASGLCTNGTDQPPTFTDVPAGSPGQAAISRLACRGIVNGVSGGVFRPNAPVTRAEFVKMLVLTLGLQPLPGMAPFSDVPVGAWYAPYVAAAVHAGIVNGVSPTAFGPQQPVTREQMAVLLARVLDLTQTAPLHFSDAATVSPWALTAVQEAVAAGYLTGFPDGTLRPLAPATRAEAAVALAQVLQAMSASAIATLAASAPVPSCVLGASPTCQRLMIVGASQGDSQYSNATVGGKAADIFQKNTAPGGGATSYIYFQVDRTSEFLASNPSTLYLNVEYYDQSQAGACTAATPCFLGYNYDSSIASAPINGAYAGTATQPLTGQAQWRWVTWKLTQASFQEKENNQADFRLAGTVGLAVHRVVLSLQSPAVTSTEG